MLCKTTNARKVLDRLSREAVGAYMPQDAFESCFVFSVSAPVCILMIELACSTQPGIEAAAPEISHHGHDWQGSADAELSMTAMLNSDVLLWQGVEGSSGHGAANATGHRYASGLVC